MHPQTRKHLHTHNHMHTHSPDWIKYITIRLNSHLETIFPLNWAKNFIPKLVDADGTNFRSLPFILCSFFSQKNMPAIPYPFDSKKNEIFCCCHHPLTRTWVFVYTQLSWDYATNNKRNKCRCPLRTLIQLNLRR